MTDYSRTRSSISDIQSDVKTLLQNISTTWNVKELPYNDYERVFQYLPTLQPPFCVLFSTQSKYDSEPHRTCIFSILVGIKKFFDVNAGATSAQDMIDSVVSALDNQLLETSTVWVKVLSDEQIRAISKTATAQTIIYKIQIAAEDY